MSRKIITQEELSKNEAQFESKKEELINAIITVSEKAAKGSGDRDSFRNINEELEYRKKVDKLFQELGTKSAEKPDDFSQRLMKYIPAEIIALYLTFNTIIISSGTNIPSIDTIQWIIFFFCMLAVILVLVRKDQVKSKIQIAISVGAFVVWIFALEGPFGQFNWYYPIYGALLLPAYTFLAPLIKPEKTKE